MCKTRWTFAVCHRELKPSALWQPRGLGGRFKTESEGRSVVSDSLLPPGLYSPWNSLGQNPGVGSLSLLQGISPTQGSNPGLSLCRWILYQMNNKGSPRILEWVAYPFSSGSSWPRNWTGVSCIAGRFFTNWAIREVGGDIHIPMADSCWCMTEVNTIL